MKKKYEKPTVVPHVSGLMNKIGRSSFVRFMNTLDNVPLPKLLEEYGSPLFVFSEEKLRATYQKFYQSFQLRYPKIRPAWSYKTNYLKAICSILHDEGAIAEVVSEFEYEKARRLGIPGDQIIFNGPAKTKEGLKRAFEEGALVFIDNFDELTLIEQVANEIGKRPQVGIRINLDSGIYPHWSRFGFNLECGQAFEVVKRIAEKSAVELIALHCHIGTFILDPSAYSIQTRKLLTFADDIKGAFKIKIRKLDLGGGYASKNTLHSQYMPGETSNPTYEQYAEAICSELLKQNCPESEMVEVYLESGRAIVDESGFLLTTVLNTRRLPDGSRSIVIDTGVSLMYPATWYKHDMLPMEDYGDFMESCSVYGPLCMNIDVIRPQIMLPVLKRGNKLVIKNVGAYCVTQWMQFIHMRPAIVLIDQNSKVHLIREKETIDHVEGPERLPDHLIRKS